MNPYRHAATLLREVTVQVGKGGILTPVAHFDPVALAGTTVVKASLQDYEEDFGS